MDLSTALRSYSFSIVQQLAQQHGIETAGRRKDDLVQRLSRHLARPEVVNHSLATLADADRSVLDALIGRGGATDAERFAIALRRSHLIDPDETAKKRLAWEKPAPQTPGNPALTTSRRYADVVARLTVAGLVFGQGSTVNSSVLDFHLPLQLIIPDEVFIHLPAVRPAFPQISPEMVTAVALADARQLQRDLYLYWLAVRESPTPMTNRGYLTKRSYQKVDSALMLHDPALAGAAGEDELGRTFFLRLLLEELDLVGEAEGGLVAYDTGFTWFRKPWPERAREVVQVWLTHPSMPWNELLRLGRAVDRTRNRSHLPTPRVQSARALLAKRVVSVPPQSWVAIETLSAMIESTDPGFLFPRTRQPAYYYGSGTSMWSNPYLPYNNEMNWDFHVHDLNEGWEVIEAAFMRAVIAETLHWLGVVDTGTALLQLPSDESRSTARPRTVFRLSADAAWLLDPHRQLLAVESAGPVIVQPNFEILAFAPLFEETLLDLDRVAERETIDQVAHYKLSRDSIYRARQQGLTADAIFQLLQRLLVSPKVSDTSDISTKNQGTLPQNVVRSIIDWAAQTDRIIIRRNVSVLETVTRDELNDLLDHLPDHVSTMLQRRGDTVVLIAVRPDNSGVLETLSAQGYPLSSDGDEGALPALDHIELDGRVVFRQPLPSLAARREIVPLVEQIPLALVNRDSGDWPAPIWRVTEASVRAAIAAGIPSEEQIAILQRQSLLPLPGELLDRMRLWGGFYGTLTVQPLALLSLERADVLSILQSDPVIGPLLEPFVAPAVVARLPLDRLDEVVNVLRQRGLSVQVDSSDNRPRDTTES